MAGARKPHLDQQRIEERKRHLETLKLLIELGDEESYVALIKQLKPAISPAELIAAIEHFREQRRQLSSGR
jgi:hypothetical protein